MGNWLPVVIYIAIINLVGFACMGMDKKKAKQKKWRIPEKNLFLVAAIGGSVGIMIGMYVYHHKTKHLTFTIGIPIIFIIQIVVGIYLNSI